MHLMNVAVDHAGCMAKCEQGPMIRAKPWSRLLLLLGMLSIQQIATSISHLLPWL